MTKHVLETAAQEPADTAPVPPFLYGPGPEGARKFLDERWTTVRPEPPGVRGRPLGRPLAQVPHVSQVPHGD